MLRDQLLSNERLRVVRADEPDAAGIREQAARILESAPFAGSERMRRFLSFAVSETLAGRLTALKEYTIGVQVFDRPVSFDPGFDPIVRVEARRLREKLDVYYRSHGRNDDVIIELPKGAYAARFRRRDPAPKHGARVGLPSVSIATFAPLSPTSEAMSEALRFELVDQLARVHGVVVMTASSGMVNVLTGCVHARGDRVRVIAHLLDGATSECRWSTAIESAMSDTAHEAIAAQIAAGVVDVLRGLPE
jgi:TolB-like protein